MTAVFAIGSEGHLELVLLAVLVAVAALVVLAYRTGLPYPVLLVAGGAALGLLPDVEQVRLEPELVLVIFLPPLLYSAAFFSSLRDLRDNVQAISLLAIGLVVVTTVAVGVVAHEVIPGLSWPAAFVLGAVVSPTDPVAASAIASRVGAPRRFVTIVEGESLVNDATGLIVYRFAVGAAVAGTFSLTEALGTFVVSAAAGVAIGVAVGFVVAAVRRRLDDAPTEITISLLTPYFAYLPAEALDVSAVLAAVVSGVWLGWRSPHLITPTTRIQAYAFWNILVFVLNAALFVLVGVQLPGIVEDVSGEHGAGDLALYSLAVVATVVAARYAWVFAASYVRWTRRERPPWREVFLVAFTGMRGAVSLAAALAIPEEVAARELVIFLTYVVIVFTVVGQGLALPAVIRALGVSDDGAHEMRESKARIKAARAALARLEELAAEEWVASDTHQRMSAFYDLRVRRFAARFDDGDDGALEERSLAYQRLRREALEAERAEIIRLRNQGFINDEVMRRIEHDLDLEDARLEL